MKGARRWVRDPAALRWVCGTTSAVLMAMGMAVCPTRAAATDFNVRGLLDLVVAQTGSAFHQNRLQRGDSPFDPYGLRVFGDARVNDRLQVFTQVVLRDATNPYVDGAYMMFTPSVGRDLNVLAGKVPWAIGTYGPRTYSNKNPLVGTPLLYQHQTSLVWYDIAGDADKLLNAAGTGPYGVNYEGYAMGPGMPIVDDSYWDVGVTIAGSERPLEYALGVIAGTPGWGSTSQDENSGKSYLGRVGLAPWPWLRVGASGSYGPYMHEKLNPELPAGRTVNDYQQKLVMADLELLFDRIELRAEGARNFWETPTVGELEVKAGYAEAKIALPIGAFLAGRVEAMRFGDITDGAGLRRSWDDNVRRFETGVGYRFSREAVGKVVVQRTLLEHPAPNGDRDFTLVAGQLSVGF